MPSLPAFILRFSKTPTRQNETDMKQNGKNVAYNETGTFYCPLPYIHQTKLLLGISWPGEVYVDKALPFRLHSCPQKFLPQ